MPKLGPVAIRIYPKNFSWEKCAGPSPAAHQYYYNDERSFRRVSRTEATARIYQMMPMPEVEVGIQIGNLIEANPRLVLIWVQVMAGPHLITSVTKDVDEVRNSRTFYTRPFKLDEAKRTANTFTVVIKTLTLGMGSAESEIRCNFEVDQTDHQGLSFSDRFVNGCNAFDTEIPTRRSSSKSNPQRRGGQDSTSDGRKVRDMPAREGHHRINASQNVPPASAAHRNPHAPRRYNPPPVPRSDISSGHMTWTPADSHRVDGTQSKPSHAFDENRSGSRRHEYLQPHHSSRVPSFNQKMSHLPQRPAGASSEMCRVPDAIHPMVVLKKPEPSAHRPAFSPSATTQAMAAKEPGLMRQSSGNSIARPTVTSHSSAPALLNGAVSSALLYIPESKEVTMKDAHDERRPPVLPLYTNPGHNVGIVQSTKVDSAPSSSSGQVVSLPVTAESSPQEPSAEARAARLEVARLLRKEVDEARDHLIAVKQEDTSSGDPLASTTASSKLGTDEGTPAAAGQTFVVKMEPTSAHGSFLDDAARQDTGIVANVAHREVDREEQIAVKLENEAGHQMHLQDTPMSAAGAELGHNLTEPSLRMRICSASTSTHPLKSNLRRTDSGSRKGKRVRISLQPEVQQFRNPFVGP